MSSTIAATPPAFTTTRINMSPVALSSAAVVAAAWFLGSGYGWRQAALFAVGTAAGVVLYHAAFGFTSSWRDLIAHRRGGGVRAQMLMLAITAVVFFPAIAHGQLFGVPVRGSISPVGVSVVTGAFLFGIGMQLGGGCASGTLYTAGGGSVRMLATLAAFIAGSVVGVLHMPLWQNAPAFAPISMVARFGWLPALLVTLAAFVLVSGVSLAIERHAGDVQRQAGAAREARGRSLAARMMRGPWPLVAGAIGLAVVNIATLALAGRPWGVTSAFALWGSKMLAMTGVNVAAWPYWQPAARAAELQASVFNDVTSVMNFGIIVGALAAAGMAGRFAPAWRVPVRSLAAAIAGGLMLGYGARIAYGCNIGAYFSGIASSSVHGWVWFAAAFAGNIFGTRLRPFFGLRV
jgi:uncharacterized membrane protein YedE/YeeE